MATLIAMTANPTGISRDTSPRRNAIRFPSGSAKKRKKISEPEAVNMAKSTPGHLPRTLGESLLDLDYAIEVSVLNQRFHERIQKSIALASLISGSVAFVTIFHPNFVVVTVAGLLVGILALLDQVYDYRGKATMHAMLARKYLRLKSRSAGMTLAKLDAAQAKIAMETIPVIQDLKRVASNNNLRRHGYIEFVKPMTRWEAWLNKLV